MKRILAATDLSVEGDLAIEQADFWARAVGAELCVYHVLPVAPALVMPLVPVVAPPQLGETLALRLAAEDAVCTRVQAVTGRGPDAFRLLLEEGAPRSAIAEKAEALAVDLVVIGAHGSGRVVGALLGSVASSVIRHAHAAVLVARPSPASGCVLAATDFSDPALPAVSTGASIARHLGGQLTVLHCAEEPTAWIDPAGAGALPYPAWTEELRASLEQEAATRLRLAMESTGAIGTARVGFGPAGPEIVRVAGALPAQVVVVGTVGRSGLRGLLLGNVAESVVRNAPCSVFVERLHRPDF